ncbi:MAG: sigma factor, partial [Arenimonas sp.]
MLRIAKQDADALAKLYELTVSRVYAVVMRVLRHAADAEEVISDVYLQVWEKANRFESERGSVMAWMNTIAWSRAVDKLRKT